MNWISLGLALSISVAAPRIAVAQVTQPTISVVTLQIVPGQQGQQCVLTPRGYVVPLPGPGTNQNSVQIFMGAQGGYWYVDKNGQNVDLTPAVQQYQAMIREAGQQARPGQQPMQVPQYAPAPAPVTIVNQQPPSSGNMNYAMGAMGTATAAGLGAMAGSAMANSSNNSGYYHVPYGTPMYYPHGASPYYMGEGNKPVAVEPSMYNNAEKSGLYNNAEKANMYNNAEKTNMYNNAEKANMYNNAEKSGMYNNAEKANMYNNAEKTNMYNNAEKSGMYNNAEKSRMYGGEGEKSSGYHPQSYEQSSKMFEQQQQYYDKQRSQNSERYKNWQHSSGENPFVRQSGGEQKGEEERHRFGQSEGEGGRRFRR
jgi:hypothetical protein